MELWFLFNVILSYYYLQKNLQFVVHLFISCLETRWKSGSRATALSELLVQHWPGWHIGGMLVESALFVLDLLCFHCVFSIEIAITNFCRDKSFSVLIRTLVQVSCFFPRWSFSNWTNVNKWGIDEFLEMLYCFLLSRWNWSCPMTSSIEDPVFLVTLLLILLESALSDINTTQHFPLLCSKIIKITLVKDKECVWNETWEVNFCLGIGIAVHWQVKTFLFSSWWPKLVWTPKPSVFLHLPFLPWGCCYWFYDKQGLVSSNPCIHMLSDCCDITNYIFHRI